MRLRAREARDAGRRVRVVQQWTNYSRISPQLTRAVLVAEDDAFWQHEGVDFVQLQESLEVDWERGRFLRGGSTITQQLAKNLYLSPSKNPVRKLREFLIARRLEAELPKSRILELYLNVIEWGDGIYGAEAAARTYFHTSAAALGPAQAAQLAASIVNPRTMNPAHPTARLLRRQQLILRRMGSVVPPAEDPPRAPANHVDLPSSDEERRRRPPMFRPSRPRHADRTAGRGAGRAEVSGLPYESHLFSFCVPGGDKCRFMIERTDQRAASRADSPGEIVVDGAHRPARFLRLVTISSSCAVGNQRQRIAK